MRSKECNNFPWQVQYRFFSWHNFFLSSAWGAVEPQKFCLMRDWLCKRDLAFCSENYRHNFSKISWAFLHPIPLSESCARLEFPSLMLCVSVLLVLSRLRASKAPCLHLPTQQSSAQCSEQRDKLLTAVGEMLKSKLSREPSFLQSSSCSS